MPILRTARRLAWRACGITGAATLAVFAAEAWLSHREIRKRAEEGVARFEAMLRDAGEAR